MICDIGVRLSLKDDRAFCIFLQHENEYLQSNFVYILKVKYNLIRKGVQSSGCQFDRAKQDRMNIFKEFLNQENGIKNSEKVM